MEHNRVQSRQIHLDFHTSELIEGIGKDFDDEEFATTLENAHVNSVTLFTRGHHGNLYYDSKLYPDKVHPHLTDKKFLEKQAAACHRHGIDVNLYTTVCWDAKAAKEHPEWIAINSDGALDDFKGKKYFEPGFYKNLCMNTGYREYCFSQIEEACRAIPAEGVWFDAAFIVECCCPTCIRKMQEEGLNPTNPADRKKFALETYHRWVREANERVKKINPHYNVSFNKGHVGVTEDKVRDCYSYYAIESLPGAEWGYMDFPISVKYNRNFGVDCLGMTGRFHTEWGDFSSFRNQEALEYECFVMIANGAKCIIGDQLPPNGRLDPYMYERIGKVYKSVMEKEPWCTNASPVTEIGVLYPEEFVGGGVGNIPPATEGVARLLQELSYQYDFIDSKTDFSKYRLLIIPDIIPVDKELGSKISKFRKNGGKILASYHSCLAPDKDEFAVDLGAEYVGEAPYSPDFILPEGIIGKNLFPEEHVMYMRGLEVRLNSHGKELLKGIKPVFNRTWEHFCSHLQSPSSGEYAYPAAVGTESSIYFMHPIFTQFQDNAVPWVRTLVKNAINCLIPDPLVQHDGPITLITNLMKQKDEGDRYILHLLHYIPERKCKKLDIIDTKIPLYNVKVRMHVPGKKAKSVSRQPSNKALVFTEENGSIEFTVPKIAGHQIIEIQWE